MATTPIVTELTKAQLDALVATNGLNEGLQYKITDKDWLLIAISNNMLRSTKALMILFNDVMPEYIDADVIWADSGFIVLTQGVPYNIPIIDNYFIIGQFFIVINSGLLMDLLLTGPADIPIDHGSGKKLINLPLMVISEDPFAFYTDSDMSEDPEGRIRFLVRYEKNYTI